MLLETRDYCKALGTAKGQGVFTASEIALKPFSVYHFLPLIRTYKLHISKLFVNVYKY